jgi:hypothetical protein
MTARTQRLVITYLLLFFQGVPRQKNYRNLRHPYLSSGLTSMGNARIGFKKYKGFRKALSKNEAQTCTECMARGCTGGTHC